MSKGGDVDLKPYTLSAIILLLIVSCESATAQAPRKFQDSQRFEVFGSLGTSWYDSSSGQSFNFGGGVGWRPFGERTRLLDGVGFELELNHSLKKELVFSRDDRNCGFPLSLSCPAN